ncbi:MAG: SH3 domain-containing protein, partial [Eubacteriales bacterium]|nr:SH3 domain-containing protein [Eubacteriales bacterium]
AYPGNTAIIITRQGLTWCRVTVPHDGATGFMMTRYLTLYGLPAVPTLRVHHPSGSYVNLRTRPSQATGIVTLRVPSGSLVTVLTPGGEWTQVKYDGKVGYMMSYFLK